MMRGVFSIWEIWVEQQQDRVRFGDYAREVGYHRYELSYNDLTRSYSQKKAGRRWLGRPWSKEWISAFLRLFVPYIRKKVKEQILAVLPLLITLLGFHLFILREPVQESFGVAVGWILVIFGLSLFLDGLRLGVMPLTEQIGALLPQKLPFAQVLLTIFGLGFVVAVAEPAVFALQSASLRGPESPALIFLSQHTLWMLCLIGMGIGLANCLQLLRSRLGFSLKSVLLLLSIPTMFLSYSLWNRPGAESFIALAFDTGAATTGPITVPLLLALGIGLSSGTRNRNSAFSGLGMLTLVAQIPVLVILFAMLFFDGSGNVPVDGGDGDSLLSVLLSSIQSLLPLLGVMMGLLFWLTGTAFPAKGFHKYGFVFCLLGLMLIQAGLVLGLIPLGTSIGLQIAGTFTRVPELVQSPLYGEATGQFVTLLFVFILGGGCAMAEPALRTLGRTLEDQSTGSMTEAMLVRTVALGVGCGFVAGIAQMMLSRPFSFDFFVLYGLALFLSALVRDEYVQVAWDCGVVTIGLVTVPVMVSLGVGFSIALGSDHAFGLLGMCMICPVLSVLMTAAMAEFKQNRGDGQWKGR